ncbi:hypothetical protein EDD91_6563 [Streptomyces sp. KS 21]|nr:hypothetical protein EDD91_6563 [Streptomyces sp. KS 21]
MGALNPAWPRGMVQMKASNVDDYLAEVPEQRRVALAEVRQLCREELVGFDEVMAHGMPAYERDGACEIALASPRQYIAFHLMRSDVREAFEEPLAEQDMGKGCKIC